MRYNFKIDKPPIKKNKDSFHSYRFKRSEVKKSFRKYNGMLFEHFIILETSRLIHYAEKPYKIFHWRSSHGAEVDLIIEAEDVLWAVEIKSYPTVKSSNLTGLKSFMQDHPKAKPLCVSTCDTPYMAGEIPVIPWKYFFRKYFLNLLE